MSKPHEQHSSHTVPVCQLHPSPLHVAELEWFFTEAESAMSPRSNLDPSSTGTYSGRVGADTVPADDAIEDRIEAAHAAGTMARRLRAMPESHALVLFAAFLPRAWPESLEAALKRLTGIAVRLTMSHPASPHSPAEHRRREDDAAALLDCTVACGGPAALSVLRWRAHVAYVEALHAYARVRGRGPTVVPGVGL
jgi:hypothetical protein